MSDSGAKASLKCGRASQNDVWFMKKASTTGITGQDGAYLLEFLLAKDFEVHGIKRQQEQQCIL